MTKLLTLKQLSKKQLVELLEVSTQMRKMCNTTYKKAPQLLGSNIGSVWQKANLQCVAVELATKFLSGSIAHYINIDDTVEFCRAMDNMGINQLVVSTEDDNQLKKISDSVSCAFINGGSRNYNPIAVLADLLTLLQKLDGLHNRTITVLGNRDTNKMEELIYCLELFSSNIVWYLPRADFSTNRQGIVVENINSAFKGADAIIDIGLKDFCEPKDYYGTNAGISAEFMDSASIEAPLLGSREIVGKNGAIAYPYATLDNQQTNNVAVAMALLYVTRKDRGILSDGSMMKIEG